MPKFTPRACVPSAPQTNSPQPYKSFKDKLEGQEFLDVNKVLQKGLVQENRAEEIKQHSRFSDN